LKLKKIKNIQGYKSFINFSWQKFFNCSDFHKNINLFFGENGSGKSSICSILKSISLDKDFETYCPKKSILQFDDKKYEFNKTNRWDDSLPLGTIVFFDKEFVSKNIHLGNNRGTHKGEQEQESGDLIIQFDREAIKLRKSKELSEKLNNEARKILREFNSKFKKILAFSLTNEEKLLYEDLKNKTPEELDDLKVRLEKEKKSIEVNLEVDKGRKLEILKIESISDIDKIKPEIFISEKTRYEALFSFNLKEQAQVDAEEKVVQKIKINKEFYERGFEIRKNNPDSCPFCQSENEEKNIKKIITAYKTIYDDTYNGQFLLFEKEKLILINELEMIRDTLIKHSENLIFLKLKEYESEYKIENIYSTSEEVRFATPKYKDFEKLIDKLHDLKKPTNEDIDNWYEDVCSEVNLFKEYFHNLSDFIESKNRQITEFKKTNTSEKLHERIKTQITSLEIVNKKLVFINENKLEKEASKCSHEKQQLELEIKYSSANEKYQSSKTEYENYCLKDVFAKSLEQMVIYFEKFNFDFKLQLEVDNRRTSSTSQFPFAFKIIDIEGAERDLKEGLSEGELQVLSLCFFFAFLDIQNDKKNKIIVFDDPITSLDNSNLSCLVDLISEVSPEFSQIFILTHHRTFFKFLRKKFKNICNEYNIIRNKKDLGGSFIFKSKLNNLFDKLKRFEENLIKNAPNGIDLENKIIEYGQYLRYEIEIFIKNTLLQRNQGIFSNIIDGIKKNKTIEDGDLDKLKGIYNFCNWTTSHVDEDDEYGLEQLKIKISDFVKIKTKYKS